MTVESHYRELLAPIYLWMAGGLESALASGAADLSDLPRRSGVAVDLGAGFGMHSIPLAKVGYEVIAIDTSQLLLEQLAAYSRGMAIRVIVDDLVTFREHLPKDRGADVITCMGDTLTHLPSRELVAELANSVAQSLERGGRFLATFRDYTTLPKGTSRFIPVRSDADQILTCFLEDRGDTVEVHDVLHRRDGVAGWTMKVSSYTKLRLDAEQVKDAFERAGLRASIGRGARGMVKLLADA